MIVSRHQSVGKDSSLLTANKCFKNMANVKGLEMIVIYQYCINEEIRGSYNHGILVTMPVKIIFILSPL
jgi:hypothetical protein